MKNIKTRLTYLKNKVSETLPDENDILEFQGISKNLIIESLDQTYSTLNLLNDYENKFESILLQRRLADCIDKASNYLKEKFKDQNPDDFNKFLNKIGEMHYASKETYILFTKEPIRLDLSLNKAKELLAHLTEQNAQIQPIVQNLDNAHKSASGIKESLDTKNAESEKKLNEITAAYNSSLVIKKKVDAASATVEKIEKATQESKIEITNNQTQLNDLLQKTQKSFGELEKNKTDFEKLLGSLNDSIEQNKEHQKNIQETIENANRVGMAASFKKRKDELKAPYWGWAIVTVLTISILIFSSYHVLTALSSNKFDLDFLLIRLPVFASFVWLGWFSAKQYGFISRIREDYSYKYAVSMAFEGYKNATKEINEEMLEHLLRTTLQHISVNPLNIYESTNNHGTPWNEVLANWRTKDKNKVPKHTVNAVKSTDEVSSEEE
jgi:hypothetical protein